MLRKEVFSLCEMGWVLIFCVRVRWLILERERVYVNVCASVRGMYVCACAIACICASIGVPVSACTYINLNIQT